MGLVTPRARHADEDKVRFSKFGLGSEGLGCSEQFVFVFFVFFSVAAAQMCEKCMYNHTWLRYQILWSPRRSAC